MSDERDAAIYLVGQGTYYRPRLLEVQYYRIIRYLELLKREDQERFWIRKTFVDLNPRYGKSEPLSYEDIPQLTNLCDAVKRGDFRFILIDLEHAGAMGAIEHELTKSGAQVINIFYDKTVLRDAFSRQFSVSRADLHSDASDFVTFFPKMAGDIGDILTDNLLTDDLASLKTRLHDLHGQRPTAGHNYSGRLLPIWQADTLREQRTRKQS
jgi:hypothetical protein